MKYFVSLICCICLTLSPGLVMAKKGGNSQGKGKGPYPSDSAYEHASENAKFKRGDDWQSGQGKYDDDLEDELEKVKKYKKEKVKGKKGEERVDEVSKSKKKTDESSEEIERRIKIRDKSKTHEREKTRKQSEDTDENQKRNKDTERSRERLLHQKKQD